MERRSQVEGQADKRSGKGFLPHWIRRIPEWRRLEEEGNLRVRAFSQGWWVGGRGGLMEEEHNFLSAASFCPTSQETGDRSGIAHPIKWPKQTRSNIQWKLRASIGFGISFSTQFEKLNISHIWGRWVCLPYRERTAAPKKGFPWKSWHFPLISGSGLSWSSPDAKQ